MSARVGDVSGETGLYVTFGVTVLVTAVLSLLLFRPRSQDVPFDPRPRDMAHATPMMLDEPVEVR